MDTEDESDERPLAEVSMVVNGEPVSTTIEPRLKLVDFLRNHLNLTGIRVGCEHGVCGACTVKADGDIVKSCLRYAVQVDGQEIETVEALADKSGLHPVQEAFHEEHALQGSDCPRR
jgi:carbon-monoxide dehydrogenase small subunit